MTTDRYKATTEGVRDAWDFWLSQHDVSVPETIAFAVKNAVNEWLNRHGDDLFREAIADALRRAELPSRAVPQPSTDFSDWEGSAAPSPDQPPSTGSPS